MLLPPTPCPPPLHTHIPECFALWGQEAERVATLFYFSSQEKIEQRKPIVIWPLSQPQKLSEVWSTKPEMLTHLAAALTEEDKFKFRNAQNNPR